MVTVDCSPWFSSAIEYPKKPNYLLHKARSIHKRTCLLKPGFSQLPKYIMRLTLMLRSDCGCVRRKAYLTILRNRQKTQAREGIFSQKRRKWMYGELGRKLSYKEQSYTGGKKSRNGKFGLSLSIFFSFEKYFFIQQ